MIQTNYDFCFIYNMFNSIDKQLCISCEVPFHQIKYLLTIWKKQNKTIFLTCFFFIIDIDDCQINPCYNSGSCFDQFEGYICECLEGFDGVNCELGKDTILIRYQGLPRLILNIVPM